VLGQFLGAEPFPVNPAEVSWTASLVGGTSIDYFCSHPVGQSLISVVDYGLQSYLNNIQIPMFFVWHKDFYQAFPSHCRR